MVGEVGFEPTSLAAQDPKSCVSANFTTRPYESSSFHRRRRSNAGSYHLVEESQKLLSTQVEKIPLYSSVSGPEDQSGAVKLRS